MTPRQLLVLFSAALGLRFLLVFSAPLTGGDTVVYLAEVAYRGDHVHLDMNLKP